MHELSYSSSTVNVNTKVMQMQMLDSIHDQRVINNWQLLQV